MLYRVQKFFYFCLAIVFTLFKYSIPSAWLAQQVRSTLVFGTCFVRTPALLTRVLRGSLLSFQANVRTEPSFQIFSTSFFSDTHLYLFIYMI